MSYSLLWPWEEPLSDTGTASVDCRQKRGCFETGVLDPDSMGIVDPDSEFES
jgi:hypothetical protein